MSAPTVSQRLSDLRHYTVHVCDPFDGHVCEPTVPCGDWSFPRFQTRAEAQRVASEAVRRGVRRADVRLRGVLLLDRFMLRGSSPRHVYSQKQRGGSAD